MKRGSGSVLRVETPSRCLISMTSCSSDRKKGWMFSHYIFIHRFSDPLSQLWWHQQSPQTGGLPCWANDGFPCLAMLRACLFILCLTALFCHGIKCIIHLYITSPGGGAGVTVIFVAPTVGFQEINYPGFGEWEEWAQAGRQMHWGVGMHGIL